MILIKRAIRNSRLNGNRAHPSPTSLRPKIKSDDRKGGRLVEEGCAINNENTSGTFQPWRCILFMVESLIYFLFFIIV